MLTTTHELTIDQLQAYHRDGYLVLKGRLPDHDIDRFEAGLERNPPLDGSLGDAATLTYPEPGRYTLANNALKDPDLAFLAEHEAIVPAAASVLGTDDPKLTAFVIYDRTPGGPGIPSHNDYKRWRPVGSSLNWVFTIVPFCDFDEAAGQLFVAPGSHRLDRITQGAERPLEVAPAVKPSEDDYIDPGLERGDLLLMNMHLWHKASGNRSKKSRVGAFNKYAAGDAPPATGYYLYDNDVYRALSERGRSIIAVHSDKPIATTRLLLTRERAETQVLLVAGEAGSLVLPGGSTFVEQAIPDWDQGNFIASLYANVRDQLRLELPWVSYVGDFDEGDHLCRTYAYTMSGFGFPVPDDNIQWVDQSQLENVDLGFGYEVEALQKWLDPSVVRGKGLTQAQSRVNQYAY